MEVNDRIELQRLISRLEEFLALHSDCTVRQVVAFLTVTLNPGINVTQLSQRMRTSQASSSRHIHTLGAVLGEKGLIAADYGNSDRRTKVLHLTESGRSLAGNLARRTNLTCVEKKDTV